MIKTFRLLLILMVFLASCKGNLTKTEIDPDTHYKTTYSIRKEDDAYHGPFSKVDSSGLLLERGEYADGQLHGIRELLFPDGEVKVRERYNKGLITDLYEYYYANGQLELQGYYIDGAMNGIWKKYHESGELLEEVTMVNNEELGPFKEYHKNGKIQTEGSYLHGSNEDGELKLYDESGELYKTMECDSGKCVTKWEKI